MFDLWYELPTWLRVVMGLLLIVLAVVIFLVTGRVIAIGLGAVGLVFVLAAGAGNNTGGYNF